MPVRSAARSRMRRRLRRDRRPTTYPAGSTRRRAADLGSQLRAVGRTESLDSRSRGRARRGGARVRTPRCRARPGRDPGSAPRPGRALDDRFRRGGGDPPRLARDASGRLSPGRSRTARARTARQRRRLRAGTARAALDRRAARRGARRNRRAASPGRADHRLRAWCPATRDPRAAARRSRRR